jgi:hypothetical protein
LKSEIAVVQQRAEHHVSLLQKEIAALEEENTTLQSSLKQCDLSLMC